MLMIVFMSEFFLVYGAQTLPVSSSITIFLISFLIIGLMVVYYLLEHKKNQMKIDWILLPTLIIFSGLMIWTIFRQGDRTFLHSSTESVVTFTTLEKLTYSLEVLIWMSSLYMVFYLHNRVETIEEERERLEKLLPNVRIAVGHGQMPEDELEEVIKDFVEVKYDVLLCTMIVESGIDMPNVNTIIIDDAHRFGLADLYQLRGRHKWI